MAGMTKGPGTLETVSEADRSSILSELGKLKDAGDAKDVSLAEPDAGEGGDDAPDPDETAAGEAGATADAEETPEDADEPDEQDEEDPSPEGEDAEVATRLERVHRADARAKQREANVRRELEAKEQALAQREAVVAQFDQMKAQFLVDPVGVMMAYFGVPEDQLEYIAQQAYWMSPAAAQHPQYRAYAEHVRAQRAEKQRVTNLEEAYRRSEEDRQTQAVQAQAEQAVSEWIDAATATVSGEQNKGKLPLVKRMLKKHPKVFRAEVRRLADEITIKNRKVPEHGDVLQVFEENLKYELEMLDIPYESVAGSPVKQKNPVSRRDKRPSTLSGDLGTPTPSKHRPRTREEEIERTRRDLLSGNIE